MSKGQNPLSESPTAEPKYVIFGEGNMRNSYYYFIPLRSVADIICSLESSVSYNEKFEMIVRRSDVLDDAFRRMSKLSFNPSAALTVN